MVKEINKEMFKYLCEIIFLVLFVIISSFVWRDANFSYNTIISNANEYYDANSSIEELSSGINLSNAYPVSDVEGIKNDGYKFMIKKSDNKEFSIRLVNTESSIDNLLDYKYIRYEIIKDGEVLVPPTNLSDNGILFNDSINNNTVYELKMWIDINASNDAMNKIFSTKIALM